MGFRFLYFLFSNSSTYTDHSLTDYSKNVNIYSLDNSVKKYYNISYETNNQIRNGFAEMTAIEEKRRL